MRLRTLFFTLGLSCSQQTKMNLDTAAIGDGTSDIDGDGFWGEDDCDDNNSSINPNSSEICDGIDNDCDGDIDEDVTSTFYFDGDGDGFGADDDTEERCSSSEEYVDSGGDCDDQNNTVYPSAPEQCDEVDNDCNGVVDDDLTTQWFADADTDGFGNAEDVLESCLQPEGYVEDDSDCNDMDEFINPQAEEVCDEQDNDCDGDIDEDVTSTFYLDADTDGYGSSSSTMEGCTPPDGYSIFGGDCDDFDSWTNPGVEEYCHDFVDNNCDGSIDDAASVDALLWFADSDEDGFGDSTSTMRSCTQPSGYTADNQDCDDGDASIYPGSLEICDGLINDCQTTILPTNESDDDGDGYVECTIDPNGWDGNSGVIGGDDCDDNETTKYLGAIELCDGLLNDCQTTTLPSNEIDDDEDGYVECSIDSNGWDGDSGVVGGDDCDDTLGAYHVSLLWYMDQDEDGQGDPAQSIISCAAPTGYVLNSDDCNDSKASIFLGATELCDGLTNDCQTTTLPTNESDDDGDGYVECSIDSNGWDGDSGVIGGDDCDDADTAVYVPQTWYVDSDSDGYGDPDNLQSACNQPSGSILLAGDCNDSNASVNPSATESCNSVDDDCNGQTDEGVQTTYYRDVDGDGYGNSADTTLACAIPNGYAATSTDCNDSLGFVYPGAAESCNSIDDDCDGQTDENVQTTYYQDSDNDGYGHSSNTTLSCSTPTGYTTNNTDCNDNSGSVYPGANESCNSIDDDCDGQTDENVQTTYYQDSDNDGYGHSASTTLACSVPSGYAANNTDCDDGAGTVYPGASESCNSIDDDCDGQTDENVQTTYYQDLDGDGYGTTSGTTLSCSVPSGYSSSANDCNDGSSSIYPSAPEQCNLTDNDCDGQVDEGASCRSAIYRGLSSSTGRHFYSTSQSLVSASGYNISEGIGFYVYKNQVSGTIPLYRCHSGSGYLAKTFLTTSSSCEVLPNGYIAETLGYIATQSHSGTTPLFRLYINSIDNHFYTRSSSERSFAVSIGYTDEGSPGRVWTSSNQHKNVVC